MAETDKDQLYKDFISSVNIKPSKKEANEKEATERDPAFEKEEKERVLKEIEATYSDFISNTTKGWLFPEVKEKVQPSRDRARGRLLAGPGAHIGGVQPRPAELRKAFFPLSQYMESAIANARKFAMEQNIAHVIARQNEEQNKLKKDPLANPSLRLQVITLMSRIYIGGISTDIQDSHIRQAFNPYGSIKKIDMSYDTLDMKHKGFAFVEFDVPDAAQLALSATCHHSIAGRPVKVGRPSNMPQATPHIETVLNEAKKYPRIYVANIHKNISKDDLKCVFEAFGRITNVDLSFNICSSSHRGFAFIDYADQKSANDAMSAMNRFDIGGQLLRVGRAVSTPMEAEKRKNLPSATSFAAAAVAAKIKSQQGFEEPRQTNSERKRTSAGGDISNTKFSEKESDESKTLSKKNIEKSFKTSSNYSKSSNVLPDDDKKSKKLNGLADKTKVEKDSSSTAAQSSQDNTSMDEEKKLNMKSSLREKTELKPVSSELIETDEAVSIKGLDQRFLMMKKLVASRKTRSNVLIMRNMVELNDIDDSLEEDIREECEKFGHVKNIIIHQEPVEGNEIPQDPVIKVFVEYERDDDAESARAALDGRFFAGKVIKVEIYDEMKYKYGDLSG